MAILYHVSYDRITRFELRVPKNRLDDEDSVTPRICFATSIEDCVNAKPGQAEALCEAKRLGINMALYVYAINTKDVPSEDIIRPTTLYSDYGVKDAIHNQEHWLTAVPPDGTIVETRYEFVDGEFLPPNEYQKYPMAETLALTTSESVVARRLESVREKMGGDACRYTTDEILAALGDKLLEYISETRKDEKS